MEVSEECAYSDSKTAPTLLQNMTVESKPPLECHSMPEQPGQGTRCGVALDL